MRLISRTARRQIDPPRLLLGDSRELLKRLPDNSVDAVVTDPPAGVGFMSKGWDCFREDFSHLPPQAMEFLGGVDLELLAFQNFLCGVFAEVLRILKPGGHGLVWALPRTSHHTAMALERAGFVLRECVTHIRGTGFPKSQDAARQIDMHLCQRSGRHFDKNLPNGAKLCDGDHLCPPHPSRAGHEGEGTALKPAAEHWWLIRKPMEGTLAANLLKWGTGVLDIEAGRLGDSKRVPGGTAPKDNDAMGWGGGWHGPATDSIGRNAEIGRWPPNLIFSHNHDCADTCTPGCPVAELDRQSGATGAAAPVRGSEPSPAVAADGVTGRRNRVPFAIHEDSGGASRFFYCPTPTQAERETGQMTFG